MRTTHFLFLVWLLLPGVALAQANGEGSDPSTNNANLTGEVNALREALTQTQKQLAAQQQDIESLRAQLKAGRTNSATNERVPPEGEKTARDSASSALQATDGYAGTNIELQSPVQGT